MALIKCPECEREISDRADICTNCGYPIKQSPTINDNDMDGKFAYEKNMECPVCHVTHKWVEKREAGTILCPVCGYCHEVDSEQAEMYRKMGAKTQQQKVNNVPKCPTCGSTNIQKISTTAKVAGAIGFGLLSKTAKSQFKCNKCGYKW